MDASSSRKRFWISSESSARFATLSGFVRNRGSPASSGSAERFGERRELAVVTGRDHDPPVACLERLVGRDDPECGSHRPGNGAASEVAGELVREPVHRSFEQREIDELRVRTLVASAQGRQDRDHRPHAGSLVDHGDAGPRGRAPGLARHAHDPARRLHQRVVARMLSQRAVLAEGADRAVDDAGVARPHGLEPEAQALREPRPQVLDEDVRALGDAENRLETLRRLQVDREGSLARVRGEVRGALAVPERRPPGTGVVATLRVLDLDDVGSERTEDQGCVRARERGRQIEDADAVERAEHAESLPSPSCAQKRVVLLDIPLLSLPAEAGLDVWARRDQARRRLATSSP